MAGFAAGYVSKRGGGISFIGFGPKATSTTALVQQLLSSVNEHEPPKPGPAPSGQLADALKGMKLLYMKTENGFSDKEDIYLCSNGSAILSTENNAISYGGAMDVTTYAGVNSGQGSWKVNGNTVVVVLGDGNTRTWPAALREDGSVDIQTSNWWVQAQSQCP
jgi:hypothetical protein